MNNMLFTTKNDGSSFFPREIEVEILNWFAKGLFTPSNISQLLIIRLINKRAKDIFDNHYLVSKAQFLTSIFPINKEITSHDNTAVINTSSFKFQKTQLILFLHKYYSTFVEASANVIARQNPQLCLSIPDTVDDRGFSTRLSFIKELEANPWLLNDPIVLLYKEIFYFLENPQLKYTMAPEIKAAGLNKDLRDIYQEDVSETLINAINFIDPLLAKRLGHCINQNQSASLFNMFYKNIKLNVTHHLRSWVMVIEHENFEKVFAEIKELMEGIVEDEQALLNLVEIFPSYMQLITTDFNSWLKYKEKITLDERNESVKYFGTNTLSQLFKLVPMEKIIEVTKNKTIYTYGERRYQYIALFLLGYFTEKQFSKYSAGLQEFIRFSPSPTRWSKEEFKKFIQSKPFSSALRHLSTILLPMSYDFFTKVYSFTKNTLMNNTNVDYYRLERVLSIIDQKNDRWNLLVNTDFYKRRALEYLINERTMINISDLTEFLRDLFEEDKKIVSVTKLGLFSSTVRNLFERIPLLLELKTTLKTAQNIQAQISNNLDVEPAAKRRKI